MQDRKDICVGPPTFLLGPTMPPQFFHSRIGTALQPSVQHYLLALDPHQNCSGSTAKPGALKMRVK